MKTANVKFKYSSGEIGKVKAPFTIGDIVNVIDPGYQYTSHRSLFCFFWGNDTTYHIPYRWNEEEYTLSIAPSEKYKQWKIVNAAFYGGRPIAYRYHIRDKEGHNAVVNEKALKLIRRPREASIGIATFKQIKD